MSDENLNKKAVLKEVNEIATRLDENAESCEEDMDRLIELGSSELSKVVGDTLADHGYPETCIGLLRKYEDGLISEHWSVADPILDTLNLYSDTSSKFAEQLATEDILTLFNKFLTEEDYLAALKDMIQGLEMGAGESDNEEEEEESDDDEQQETGEKGLRVYNLFENLLSILQNIAYETDSSALFTEAGIFEAIQPLMEEDETFAALGLFIQIYSAEKDVESEDFDIVATVISWLKEAIHSDTRSSHGCSAADLVYGLQRLASKDSEDSRDHVVDKGAVPLLLNLLLGESEEEQSAAASCIWELAEDPDVQKIFASNKRLIKTLESLKESESKGVRDEVGGALWVIQGESDQKTSSGSESAAPGNKHVFISYNWSDKPTVLKIHEELKKNGYNVWIDGEKMHAFNSLMDGMAHAVENAAVVLMCMSEKYKDSKNCKLEAEYTTAKDKEVIPLLTEPKYTPDGWLGLTLGCKVYIDFSGKYPFEEKMNELLMKIGQRGKTAA